MIGQKRHRIPVVLLSNHYSSDAHHRSLLVGHFLNNPADKKPIMATCSSPSKATAVASTQTAVSKDTKRCIYLEDTSAYDLEKFLVPHHYQPYLESVLIPSGMIKDRVEKLAQDIRYDYEGKTIHLLCVLKGGSAFFHDLVDKLRLFHKYNQCDYVPFTFDFIRVKSYDGTSSSGAVTISGADCAKFRGKQLLVVEDIIDTGRTMQKLIPYLQTFEPASVKVASLVEKRHPQSCGFQADYVGFSIPDRFVVGYCLDYDEIFRDLHHICVINQKGIDDFAATGARRKGMEYMEF